MNVLRRIRKKPNVMPVQDAEIYHVQALNLTNDLPHSIGAGAACESPFRFNVANLLSLPYKMFAIEKVYWNSAFQILSCLAIDANLSIFPARRSRIPSNGSKHLPHIQFLIKVLSLRSQQSFLSLTCLLKMHPQCSASWQRQSVLTWSVPTSSPHSLSSCSRCSL